LTVRHVAVTGATGFLGRTLLEQLRGRDDMRVSALTRNLVAEAHHAGRVDWKVGDLSSPVDAASFVRDADTFVHLAGSNTPLTSNAHLPSDVLGNLVPTLTLIQAIRERGHRPHVVFASSGGTVYAVPSKPAPVDETAPTVPTSSYGVQKLACESYLRIAAEHGWLTATILRIGNPYGVLLPPERLQGFIGIAVMQLAKGRAIRVFGDTRNVRDYVHLDDVNAVFETVLDRTAPFEVFNVGSGEGHSVDEIVQALGELTGREVAVTREDVAGEPGDLPSWIVLDVRKARRVLGWRPTVALRDGLCRLLEEAGVS
jgi:UDP-glucose 4-epimerase